MKKYRIEMIVFGLFGLVITALMWKPLFAIFKFLPGILMGLWVLAIVLIARFQFKGDANLPSERYAPKEFFKVTLSSVLGIAIAVAAIAVLRRGRFSTQLDLTTEKTNSLKEETLKILGKLDKDVMIYCVPPLQMGGDFCQENHRLRQLLTQHNSHITHRALSLQNPQDIALLGTFNNIAYGALVFKSGDYVSEVTDVSESSVANALLNVLMGGTKKEVLFLTGGTEPGFSSDKEGASYDILKNQLLEPKQYEVKEYNYLSGEAFPTDAQVVVLGPSKTIYPDSMWNHLRGLIARGGKLLVSMNPLVKDPGLNAFLAELGINVESDKLLVTDPSAPLGESLSKLNVFPPVAVGNFSRVSPMTSVFPPRALMVVPHAVALGSTIEQTEGYTIKHTALMNSLVAENQVVNDEVRFKLLQKEPLRLEVAKDFNQSAMHNVAYQVEIENPQKLYSQFADEAALKSKQELIQSIQKEGKEIVPKSEVAVFGFPMVHQYVAQSEIGVYLPFLTLAHLHSDAELISFDQKKATTKGLDLSKNPEGYLFLFAGILPFGTLLTGLRFWLRRRRS